MKKFFLPTLVASVLLTAAFFTGCKKETSADLTPEEEKMIATTSSEEELDQEMASNDVFDNVMGVDAEVGIGGTGIFGKIMSTEGRELRTDSIRCFTVSKVRLNAPNLFPAKVTIDFGAGCMGKDSVVRSGKIVTVYTGPLRETGSSATTTFENFKINNISVQGTHKVTNTTATGSARRQFTITVTDAKLTRPNGDYSQWSGERVITQIEGNGTPLIALDDIFSITGHGGGKVKHGADLFVWRSEITDPLIKRFTCRWISRGVIKVRRESTSTTSPWVATLDFGTGNCDNQATLTINGVSKQITLR